MTRRQGSTVQISTFKPLLKLLKVNRGVDAIGEDSIGHVSFPFGQPPPQVFEKCQQARAQILNHH